MDVVEPIDYACGKEWCRNQSCHGKDVITKKHRHQGETKSWRTRDFDEADERRGGSNAASRYEESLLFILLSIKVINHPHPHLLSRLIIHHEDSPHIPPLSLYRFKPPKMSPTPFIIPFVPLRLHQQPPITLAILLPAFNSCFIDANPSRASFHLAE